MQGNSGPCATGRATLCWLDVSEDRITQRHRRLVKTENKVFKSGIKKNRDDCVSLNCVAPPRYE